MLYKLLCKLKESAVGLGIMLGAFAGCALAVYSLPAPAIYLGPIVIPSVYVAIAIIVSGAAIGGAIGAAIGGMINLEMTPRENHPAACPDESCIPPRRPGDSKVH